MCMCRKTGVIMLFATEKCADLIIDLSNLPDINRCHRKMSINLSHSWYDLEVLLVSSLSNVLQSLYLTMKNCCIIVFQTVEHNVNSRFTSCAVHWLLFNSLDLFPLDALTCLRLMLTDSWCSEHPAKVFTWQGVRTFNILKGSLSSSIKYDYKHSGRGLDEKIPFLRLSSGHGNSGANRCTVFGNNVSSTGKRSRMGVMLIHLVFKERKWSRVSVMMWAQRPWSHCCTEGDDCDLSWQIYLRRGGKLSLQRDTERWTLCLCYWCLVLAQSQSRWTAEVRLSMSKWIIIFCFER